jgi:uncharacterized membrane protein
MDLYGSRNPRILQTRTVLAAIWGGLCLWILAAPVLQAHGHSAAALLAYFPFSFICHQIPGRSFSVLQYPFAVCHRCFGIYAGLLLGSIFSISYRSLSWRTRRLAIVAAALPLLLDTLLPLAGLWTNTWWSRSCTGILLGWLLSPLLIQGMSELLDALLQRPFAVSTIFLKGDCS